MGIPLVKFKWIFRTDEQVQLYLHSNRKPTKVFTTMVDGLLGGVLAQRRSQVFHHPRHACVVRVWTAQHSTTFAFYMVSVLYIVEATWALCPAGRREQRCKSAPSGESRTWRACGRCR